MSNPFEKGKVWHDIRRLAHGAEPVPEQRTVTSPIYGAITGMVHDVRCDFCEHRGAVCVHLPGGNWMLMHCVNCQREFEIDGE